MSAQCGNAGDCLKHPIQRNNIYLLRNFMNRRYTKFYGTHGNAAANIAHDAILGNDCLYTQYHISRIKLPDV